MSAALEVVHRGDPKATLLTKVAPLVENVTVFGDDALIAVYNRGDDETGEARSKGNIIIPSTVVEEDDFQGKIGLLVKVGPLFLSKGERDESNKAFFGDNAPRVGDWVMFRASDTYSFKIKKKLFRMCEARMLRGKVASPDIIW